jgi:hypothetical protein
MDPGGEIAATVYPGCLRLPRGYGKNATPIATLGSGLAVFALGVSAGFSGLYWGMVCLVSHKYLIEKDF